MNRLLSLASAAIVLFMIAGCEARVTMPDKLDDIDPRAGVTTPGEPPARALNVFTAYATGVEGVVVLIDRDTGCQFIATQVTKDVQGYTSIIARPTSNAVNGARLCRD